ncbi:MAG: hypothetical protein QOI20_2925 [Acidimicrobiaceae bacterium]|nr:hypothetical protein [Acidimicrobiaceae bacterium]
MGGAGGVARPGRVALAALLASMAAAWVAGGVFQGWMARPVALAGAAAGVGGVWLAVRRNRPVLQYGVVPGAFVLGYLAALILPNDTGVTGTVPELVRRAIQNGGLSEPPVPFDPGWRFIIVALLTLIGAASASLALGLQRPKLTLLIPLPLVIAAALSQPTGGEVLAGVVALVLLVAGLMMTFSAELADEADTGPRFEARQLLRGAGGVGAALVVVGALSQASLLFPEPKTDRSAKPQKPQIQPLNKVRDRPLFEVQADSGVDASGPWRLGVLDEYDKGGWLLPPLDLKRFQDRIPPAPLGRPTIKALVTVQDIGGFNLPVPASPVSIGSAGGHVGYDPRTQVLRVRKGSPGIGYRYTIEAARPPTGDELAAAVGTVPADVARFAQAPEPPLLVSDLLAGAPTNQWERLQFMRSKLYASVVASGAGVPVDINGAKVAELLRGGTGTPYEIVAAEALLARWAGLPARIGYGFKGGTKLPTGAVEFRPKDGANWLEVWFPNLGWTPVVGVPPKAQASLNNESKKIDDQVRPSEDLSLQIYLPVQNPNPLLFFQVVRYWVFAALPFVLAAAALLWAMPWLLKLWRRRRRLAWATSRGPGARVAVAYAEFRDMALDLNIGDPTATPLEFLEAVDDDDEHAELAWLVTRGLYGDLSRDLRDADADAAEVMSASLRRRLARAQSGVAQVTGAVAKASLRRPYDPALPNAWVKARSDRRAERRQRRGGTGRPRLLRRLVPALGTVLALITGSCGGAAVAKQAGPLPANVLPADVLSLRAALETGAAKAFGKAGSSSMVAKGSFWTLRSPSTSQVQAALQVSVLKPRFDTKDIVVRRGIRQFIETGQYRWFKMEGQWIGVQELSELRLYLWFPPRGDVFEILQVRPEYPAPKQLLAEVLRFQKGAL